MTNLLQVENLSSFFQAQAMPITMDASHDINDLEHLKQQWETIIDELNQIKKFLNSEKIKAQNRITDLNQLQQKHPTNPKVLEHINFYKTEIEKADSGLKLIEKQLPHHEEQLSEVNSLIASAIHYAMHQPSMAQGTLT